MPFGKELILDLHDCQRPFDRATIHQFFIDLCRLIKMRREKIAWWDYPETGKDYDKLRGLSAVQFIRTSSITVHALDASHRLYVNVFSCKPFSASKAAAFTAAYFQGKIVGRKVVKRR